MLGYLRKMKKKKTREAQKQTYTLCYLNWEIWY